MTFDMSYVRSNPISYHTEAFVKTEIGCAVCSTSLMVLMTFWTALYSSTLFAYSLYKIPFAFLR